MVKTPEELTAIKEEVKAVAGKLRELTPEELESVSGGFKVAPEDDTSLWRKIVDWFFRIAD